MQHSPRLSTVADFPPSDHYPTGLAPPTRPAPSPSVPSPAIFEVGRLPRTSSLLPPPHGSTAVSYSQPSGHPRGPSPNQNPKAHRASPSVATINDEAAYTPTAENFYNIRRWSQSTGSANSPEAARKPSLVTNLGRNGSVDASADRNNSSPGTSRPPGRKLQKNRRPSTSRSPAVGQKNAFEDFDFKPNEPTLTPILPGLPLISPLLSLEQSVGGDDKMERTESPFTNPNPFAERPGSAAASVTLNSTFSSKANPDSGRQTPSAQPRSHSRQRSRPSKGSNDMTKPGAVKQPSQKTMLHRALQKANTAVQLDNAHNYGGARQAYAEACTLLQQVLDRTHGEEDKKKLEAIRRTYTTRIDELDQMGPWHTGGDSKALPDRPESGSTTGNNRQSVLRIDEDGSREPVQSDNPFDQPESDAQHSSGGLSLRSRYNDSYSNTRQEATRPDPPYLQSSFSSSPRRLRTPSNDFLGRPDPVDVPRPLTPGRNASPQKPQLPQLHTSGMNGIAQTDFAIDQSPQRTNASHPPRGHLRDDSINSWLDPIDESGGSTSSSVHSRTSSMGYRRRHIRGGSGHSEAELDAAMDAAIEAAYDEGYEPMGADELNRQDDDDQGDEIVANALRRVEEARERKRQAEREIEEEEARRQEMLRQRFEAQDPGGFFDDQNSSDEDEQVLEMNKEQYHEEEQKSSAVPRESDSSGLTSRTYHSSTGSSNAITGGTSFSMVSESKKPEMKPKLNLIALGTPAAPPPTSSLPELPPQSARNKRLSAQKPKDLKIETSRNAPAVPPKATEEQPRPKTSNADGSQHPGGLRRPSIEISPSDTRLIGSPFATSRTQPDSEQHNARVASPTRPGNLHKNFSSTSLRSMKARNMSLSNLEDGSDMSPTTPGSQPMTARTPAMPALPSGLAAQPITQSVNGHFLFATDIHDAKSPGIPNPLASTGIVALEPCPTDSMLRPFWLMRCLYQTLVNPRGGYLSQKLFVPRDVWRVRGVKLKNLDLKISQCDLLTAALLKLDKVDSFDADAMLEEMQSLEGVFEQVQALLTSKLGSEVGIHGSGMMFKEATNSIDESSTHSSATRSGSVSNKSSSFSWRRLRSKNSAAGLQNSYSNGGQRTVSGGEGEPGRGSAGGDVSAASLASLPMTGNPTSKPAKRDVAMAQFTGPNAQYMSALARLFDAAQAIDMIARQVEDPGLRHADTTQVGLELCTRHAAEFFGFYICRFVLSDMGMLLDKFIKRGSEWVMV